MFGVTGCVSETEDLQHAVTDWQQLHHSLTPKLAMQRETMIYKSKTVFQLQITVFSPWKRGNTKRENRDPLTLQPVTMSWPQ